MPVYGDLTFEQVTVAGTAIGITQNPGSATSKLRVMAAEIVVETAPIRYRTDGTDPTSSVGTLVDIGGVIILASPGEVRNFKAIRTTGVSALLDVKTGLHYHA